MIYGGEFMKTYCKSLKNVLLFSIIIAIQLFVTIYFELQKDSLFGDELFSYAFANAFYTNTVNISFLSTGIFSSLYSLSLLKLNTTKYPLSKLFISK